MHLISVVVNQDNLKVVGACFASCDVFSTAELTIQYSQFYVQGVRHIRDVHA